MKLLKQSTEYNCGVFALHFLLQCHGLELDLTELEKVLGTTEDDGTSHESLIRYLKERTVISGYNTPVARLAANLPAIVNYQYTDEGHYSVVLNITPTKVLLYNPDIGELELLDIADFERDWYSKLYGNKWFLSIQ